MTWDYDRSKERIQKHLDGMGEIKVGKLVREADLQTLLTETECREIRGAHVYATVPAFAPLASDQGADDPDYAGHIQAVHLYQREVGRIVESTVFDGLRVHFQGPKLHALFYRPIDGDGKLAARAVLLQLVLRDFVFAVFNPAFPTMTDVVVAGGADLGDVVGTKNGSRADRELLFLGPAANHAAKIIGAAGRLRVTERLAEALPESLADLCESDGEDLRLRQVDADELDELLDEFGFAWDRDRSAARVESDRGMYPLDRIRVSSADTLIDVDELGIFDNKRVTAASVFGDVAGFTAYIDAAETDEEKKTALRVLHAIRREMARVVRSDFGGVRLQFQGDRVQALFHLPKDDDDEISRVAVDAGIGLQSSMEHAVKELLPEAADLRLAVGVDLGTTLVTKLGTRSHRDRICLGSAVEGAAANEERCLGGWTGISKVVRDGLEESLRDQFAYDASARCYVADGLTVTKADRLRRARAYAEGGLYTGRAAGLTILTREAPGARPIQPAKPYAPAG